MNLAPYLENIFNIINDIFVFIKQYWYMIIGIGIGTLILVAIINMIRGK